MSTPELSFNIGQNPALRYSFCSSPCAPVQDWWNATTIGDYWRLWNMPVHKWMLRHVYFPALRAGVPRVLAGTLVFAVRTPLHRA